MSGSDNGGGGVNPLRNFLSTNRPRPYVGGWLTERAVRRLARAGYTVHPGHCEDWIDWPPLPRRTLASLRSFQLLQGISDTDGAA